MADAQPAGPIYISGGRAVYRPAGHSDAPASQCNCTKPGYFKYAGGLLTYDWAADTWDGRCDTAPCPADSART